MSKLFEDKNEYEEYILLKAEVARIKEYDKTHNIKFEGYESKIKALDKRISDIEEDLDREKGDKKAFIGKVAAGVITAIIIAAIGSLK